LIAPINTSGSCKPIPYALFEEFVSKRCPKQIFMIAWHPWEQGFIMATTEKDPNLSFSDGNKSTVIRFQLLCP